MSEDLENINDRKKSYLFEIINKYIYIILFEIINRELTKKELSIETIFGKIVYDVFMSGL